MSTTSDRDATSDIEIRPLQEADLAAADHVFRLAFGTAFGLPDPLRFAEGADLLHGRWRADPTSACAAEVDGEIVGSAFAARWGTFAMFGPLTVHPELWDRGVGKRLWEALMPLLERWGTTHAGLYTHPESTKHIHLYQKFDFWPRFLTAVTAKDVEAHAGREQTWSAYSSLPHDERERRLEDCREVTDAIYAGLDLEREIGAVADQRLGETILLGDVGALDSFAVCHAGEGSEAGLDTLFVKFAAVRPGEEAAERFDELLDACEALAAESGLSRLVAGVNLARGEAYRGLLARGHRTWIQGVAMQRPNEPGFCRPGLYVLDDWR